jgi:hypothetical protein
LLILPATLDPPEPSAPGDTEGRQPGRWRLHEAPDIKRGWRLWTGDAGAEVTSVRVVRDHVLITVVDGRTFRAGYLDAVLARTPPPV